VSLAYRRVQDEASTRPVALIVLCDACGNREIGWAWHDHGEVVWWTVVTPFVSWEGLAPETETFPEAHRRFRRSTPNDEQRRLQREVPVAVLPGSGRVLFRARCPRHGDLVTPEVELADLEPTTTRRIRATPSTA
jgi:hypothetical protein